MPDKTQVRLRDVDDGTLVVIDLAGEVTTFAEEAIVAAYHDASARGAKTILISFAEVDYINSAGIAVMIGLLAEARQRDQQIMVSGLTPHYTKIFDMMGLAQYIPIFATEDEARRSVPGTGGLPSPSSSSPPPPL